MILASLFSFSNSNACTFISFCCFVWVFGICKFFARLSEWAGVRFFESIFASMWSWIFSVWKYSSILFFLNILVLLDWVQLIITNWEITTAAFLWFFYFISISWTKTNFLGFLFKNKLFVTLSYFIWNVYLALLKVRLKFMIDLNFFFMVL